MQRNRSHNALINFILLLVVGLAAWLTARYGQVLAGQVSSYFLGLATLVCAFSWFQMRLEEQERLEQLEFGDLARTAAGSPTLFTGQGVDAFPARRAREQFEKYFVPAFTVLLCLLQGGGAFLLWRWLSAQPAAGLREPLISMSFLGMFALALFLMGKYGTGIARIENQRLLRPGANYLLLGAYLCAVTLAGMVANESGFTRVDAGIAFALCIVLGLLGIETLLTLLLEIYRPRIKGKVGPPLYESRLVGLLGHPEGLLSTAAHALDYQFGFKVSETWFYRFLERTLGWFVLAQVAALWLSTCCVFVQTGQQGLLERFGKPVSGRDLLGPGAHLKFPWPVDRVYRFTNEAIQSFSIGFEADENKEHGSTVVWAVSHYKQESHMLVANRDRSELTLTNQPGTTLSTNTAGAKKPPPVSLLSVGIPVQYRLGDIRAWAYRHKDAARLLEHIATREVVRYLVSADVQDLMSSGRFQATEDLRQRIQQRADELGLGVTNLFVGLQDVHPPVAVAAAYEAVVGAEQKRHANVLAAQAYRVQTNALALSRSLSITRQAEGERTRIASEAMARASLFTNQIPAYKASPSVYAWRAYVQALERGAGTARKYVLATTNNQEVILFNLEEKISPDVLDVPLPVAPPK